MRPETVDIVYCPEESCPHLMLGPIASARFCPNDGAQLQQAKYVIHPSQKLQDVVIRQGGKPGWAG